MQVNPAAAAMPQPGPPRIVSKAEYARHRGCSAPYISKLIRDEKLTRPALLPDGRIDRVVADAQLQARRERATDEDPLLQPPPAAVPAEDAEAEGDESLVALRKEVAREQRRKLKRENDEAEGRLVDAAAVRHREETAARMTRDALRRLPAKVSGRLAVETNETEIRAILLVAIDELLADAADAHAHEAAANDEDDGGGDDAGIR
ncbi:hypothetical protein EDC65_2259 [Stella humosa]|uniref:Uncharacterized protein n=1 Tax=Stella humosa TaxID=94 RepID=A0A3N1MCJ1_9PROT|nr:hypothetical protein [Stella humosa]ROQ00460.1 hypothetical protein EDC65_2259 [Stella humosa]BBK30295.1 hypothetical protein STHU_09290 [Stella humosa]